MGFFPAAYIVYCFRARKQSPANSYEYTKVKWMACIWYQYGNCCEVRRRRNEAPPGSRPPPTQWVVHPTMTDDSTTQERIDERATTVCPECDRTNIWTLQERDAWRCGDCHAVFETPAERAVKSGGNSRSGLSKRLDDADPDEVLPDGGRVMGDGGQQHRTVQRRTAALVELLAEQGCSRDACQVAIIAADAIDGDAR